MTSTKGLVAQCDMTDKGERIDRIWIADDKGDHTCSLFFSFSICHVTISFGHLGKM